jgi:hypothetical protein
VEDLTAANAGALTGDALFSRALASTFSNGFLASGAVGISAFTFGSSFGFISTAFGGIGASFF